METNYMLTIAILAITMMIEDVAEAGGGNVLDILSEKSTISSWVAEKQKKPIRYMYNIDYCGPRSNWKFVLITRLDTDYRWIEVVRKTTSPTIMGLIKLKPITLEREFCKYIGIGVDTDDELQLYIWVSDDYEKKEDWPKNKYVLVTYKKQPPSTIQPVQKNTYDQIIYDKKLLQQANTPKTESGCVLQFLSLDSNMQFWNSAKEEKLIQFMYTVDMCSPNQNWWRFDVFIHKGMPNYRWIEVLQLKNNKEVLWDLLKLEPDSWEDDFCKSTRVGNESEDELELYIWVSDKYENDLLAPAIRYQLITYGSTSVGEMESLGVDKSTFEEINSLKKIKKMADLLKEKDNQVDMSRAKLTAMQAQQRSTEGALSSLKEAIGEKEKQMNQLREQRDRAEQTRQEERELHEREIAEYKLKLHALKSDVEKLNARLERAQVEKDLLEARLESSQSELGKSKAELDKATSEAGRNRADWETAKQRLAKLEQEKERLKHELERSQTTLDQSTLTASQELGRSQETADKAQAELRKAQEELRVTQEDAERAAAEAAALEEKLEKSEGDISGLKAKLETAQGEQDSLRKEYDRAQLAISRMHSERDKATSALEKAREELDRTQATLGKAQLQQGKLQNQLDKAQGEVNNLQEKLVKSMGEIRRVQMDKEKQNNDFDNIQSQLGKALGQATQLQKEKETVQLEADRLRDKLEKTELMPANEAKADSGCVLEFLSLPKNRKFWYSKDEDQFIEYQYTIAKCGPSNNEWWFNFFFYNGKPESRWIEVVHPQNNIIKVVDLLKLEPNSSEEEFCKSIRVGNQSQDELQLYVWVSDKYENEGKPLTDKYFLVTYKTTPPHSKETVDKSTFDQIDQKKNIPRE